MHLWSGTLSVFSAKVRIAAAEKGLALEIRELNWSRADGWGSKPAELLAVSPRGEVPVLVDGELAVFDSTVINEYLEERFPEPALMPRDLAGRAQCRMWEELADHTLNRALPTLVSQIYLAPADPDRAAIDAATTQVRDFHQRLDEGLAGQAYLCGNYSLADIGAYLAVAFSRNLGVAPEPDLPHLADWLGSVESRPVVQAELAAILEAAAQA